MLKPPFLMVIGPSHAGKTTLLRRLRAAEPDLGGLPARVVELDGALGEDRRSDGLAAVSYVESLRRTASGDSVVLVDVGAGQIVTEAFRTYLMQSAVFVVVCCDKRTFLRRHSLETGPREWSINFSAELVKFWDAARARSWFVNTSAPASIDDSYATLLEVIRRVVAVSNREDR